MSTLNAPTNRQTVSQYTTSTRWGMRPQRSTRRTRILFPSGRSLESHASDRAVDPHAADPGTLTTRGARSCSSSSVRESVV